VLTYRLKPGSIVFVHAGVPEKLQGQHIAGKLVAAGLEFARQKGLILLKNSAQSGEVGAFGRYGCRQNIPCKRCFDVIRW